MLAKRVGSDLSDPRAKAWGPIACERVALIPVPLASQPSRYVRASWAERPYGVVRELRVRAAHDGERVYLLLEWESPTRQVAAGGENPYGDHPVSGPDAFADSVAVMFPANGHAPVETMGGDDAPVSLWRWAAGSPDTVEKLAAAGIGSVHPTGDRGGLVAHATGTAATWSVAFSQPLQPAGNQRRTALTPGGASSVAFAVWCGANQERAGTKAVSPSWIDLELEA